MGRRAAFLFLPPHAEADPSPYPDIKTLARLALSEEYLADRSARARAMGLAGL